MTEVTPHFKTEPRAKKNPNAGWAKARAECLERAKGMCRAETPACAPGSHPATEVHHIRPRIARAEGNHAQSNLLACCEPAHRWVHAHPATARKRGLLRSRHEYR